MNIQELPIYIMTDQPPTCPKCWSRADIIKEFIFNDLNTQLCQCNSNSCCFSFLEQEDDYFSEEYWVDTFRN